MIRVLLLLAFGIVIGCGWLALRSRSPLGITWAGILAGSSVAALYVTESVPHIYLNRSYATLFRVCFFFGMPTALIGLIGSLTKMEPLSARLTLIVTAVLLVLAWVGLLILTLPVS
jgi:hypothetical protein